MNLLKQRNRAVSKSRSLYEASQQLEVNIRDAIWRLKHLSRVAGSNAALKEISALDPDFEFRVANLADYSIRDWIDAKVYARNFAKLWLTYALSYKGSKYKATLYANIYSLHRLELIAATESSKSFNEGKTSVSRDYQDELYKRWDATMDANTCPICEAADGEIVHVSERFKLGEPGAVHPRCRCTYSIISRAEAKAFAA